MATKYSIYTEDGKQIATITADRVEYGTDTLVLGGHDKDNAYYTKAVIPRNWAVIEVQ